jgi:hypothetical protein
MVVEGEGEVPTLATALEEQVSTMVCMECAKMVVSPVPTVATPLEVVSPMTLNLKGEMPTYATMLEGSDSTRQPFQQSRIARDRRTF